MEEHTAVTDAPLSRSTDTEAKAAARPPLLIPPGRIPLLDQLRGLALVAMTLYHFVWDLRFFNYLLPDTAATGGWVILARCIAFSFLFLVGIGLFIAHRDGVKRKPFLLRLAQVGGAAAVISLVTYFAVPGGFIFFGILHAIALFSVLGLLFLRLPWWLTLGFALVVGVVGLSVNHEFFATPWLWWAGLSPTPPPSNDYVPLFPWFAATLLGIAAAQLMPREGWFRAAETSFIKPLGPVLGFMGRHSLVYYLIHQPILIGLIWAFVQINGPPDYTPTFSHLCNKDCLKIQDEGFCQTYCGCMKNTLNTMSLMDDVRDGKLNFAQSQAGQDMVKACSREAF